MTLRAAAVLLLSAALLPAAFSNVARAEGAAPAAAPAPETRRPAGGLLSHSFSDVVEDAFGLAPERPEAAPEAGGRADDPAVPAPGQRPR